MTIQLSVLVWTIICFLLAVLILHNLLLKPVLELLDRRKERIKNAAQKKAEYEKLADEYDAMAKEKKAKLLEQQKNQARAEIERLRADSKLKLGEANAERLHRVDAYRAKAEAECGDLLRVLSGHAQELAVSFAESLIKE